jgi:hypothetical protein
MGVSLAQLDKRDIARLRAELCEVIAARFAWPGYFDFRSGTVRTRPVGAARRQEINAFVHAAILDPIEQVELSGPEVRRYLEALLLRYLEINHDLARGASRRRLSAMRVDVPRAAAEVQRGLLALAAGKPGEFGAQRPVVAWSDAAPRKGRKEPSEDAAQRGADQLSAALMGNKPASAAPAAPSTAGRMPASIAPLPPQPPRTTGPEQGVWARVPMDRTAPLPAIPTSASAGGSPFAGLEGGSQSAMFGASATVTPSEQPTGQLPVVGLSGVMPRRSDGSRELPPNLMKMYSDYLRDGQPEAAPTSRGATGTHPVPGARPAGPPAPSAPPTPEQARTDAEIFAQLRFQIEAYIRLAARSYNIRPGGTDPASALDALRRSGHVDEADLRIAESILALSDRVVANGGGTVEDYRQALLLYLLYHRGRLSM